MSKQNFEVVDWDNILEYTLGYDTLKKDTELRDILNKKLSANIKHCFSVRVSKDKDVIDFGSGRILIVNAKGEVNTLWSSEWASIHSI